MKKTKDEANTIIELIFEVVGLWKKRNLVPSDKCEGFYAEAVLAGLACFLIAGIKKDNDLAYNIVPCFQQKIMNDVTEDEYNYFSKSINDAYVEFRNIALPIPRISPETLDYMYSMFGEKLRELINLQNVSNSDVLKSFVTDFGDVLVNEKYIKDGNENVPENGENNYLNRIGWLNFNKWVRLPLSLLIILLGCLNGFMESNGYVFLDGVIYLICFAVFLIAEISIITRKKYGYVFMIMETVLEGFFLLLRLSIWDYITDFSWLIILPLAASAVWVALNMVYYRHRRDYWNKGEKSAQTIKTKMGDDADEIRKWKDLFDDGLITAEEFQRKKYEILYGFGSKKKKNTIKAMPVVVSCLVVVALFAAYVFLVPWLNTKRIAMNDNSVLTLYCYDYDGNLYCTGSGFICFNDKTLVTNYHVIAGASTVMALTNDDTMYEVYAVRNYTPEDDIAILTLDESTGLNPLKIGSSEKLAKGDKLIAIGSPIGLQNTVSEGVYSAYAEGYIQFTTPISHGSSGGALFDEKGKVVGVTSASIEEGQNLNFAIPIEIVQRLYDTEPLSIGTDQSLYNAEPLSTESVYTEKYEQLYLDAYFMQETVGAEYNVNCVGKVYLSKADYYGTKVYETVYTHVYIGLPKRMIIEDAELIWYPELDYPVLIYQNAQVLN